MTPVNNEEEKLPEDPDLAILDEEDGLAYPVFCTIMVRPDASPATDEFSALRKKHQLTFVADNDQPFKPRSTTMFVHEGGRFEYRGETVRLEDLLRDYNPDDSNG